MKTSNSWIFNFFYRFFVQKFVREIILSSGELHSAFNGLIFEYDYLLVCGDFYIQLAFHIVQFPICIGIIKQPEKRSNFFKCAHSINNLSRFAIVGLS